MCYGEESAAIWQELGEHARAGVALVAAGMGAQPDYATARRLVNEGKRLVAMGGDAWQASFALVNEAYVAYVWGDLERAQALFDEAVMWLGDQLGVARIGE